MPVYAFSDLHGFNGAWKNILKVIAPEDKLICLGDSCDRGPAGFELFQEIYSHPQVIAYIMGNHEDLLVKAADEWNADKKCGEAYKLLNWNGGHHTFSTWRKTKENISWIDKVRKLQYSYTYVNPQGKIFLLSHAGGTPDVIDFDCPHSFDKFNLLWNREHFNEPWPSEKEYENIICVHGHTNFKEIARELHHIDEEYNKNKPLIYCNGHKICIDSCIVKTGYTFLYNLDTQKSIRISAMEDEFYGKKNE